jgi:pimeloyl-ACP methyl ester carboxylesterase
MSCNLVLLPGLDGTGMLFEPLLKELSPEIAPQVIPLPNHMPMSYATLVPIMSSLLPKGAPYFLLGESFSGPLSLMMASSKPEGLQGVILCASFIRNPTYFPSVLRFIAYPWLFHFASQFAQAKSLFGGYGSSELRALLARAHSQVPPVVMAQRVRSVLALDCSKALRECPVPVAYLRGARDRLVPSKNFREIQAANPSIREFVIRAPHMILQTQPRAAAEAITAFVRDFRRSSSPGLCYPFRIESAKR